MGNNKHPDQNDPKKQDVPTEIPSTTSKQELYYFENVKGDVTTKYFSSDTEAKAYANSLSWIYYAYKSTKTDFIILKDLSDNDDLDKFFLEGDDPSEFETYELDESMFDTPNHQGQCCEECMYRNDSNSDFISNRNSCFITGCKNQ